MKITDCLGSIAFFAVVLAIVSGKPTGDDVQDTDDEIAELREELAQSVGRISKLENLLAASVDIIAELNHHLATTSDPANSQPCATTSKSSTRS